MRRICFSKEKAGSSGKMGKKNPVAEGLAVDKKETVRKLVEIARVNMTWASEELSFMDADSLLPALAQFYAEEHKKRWDSESADHNKICADKLIEQIDNPGPESAPALINALHAGYDDYVFGGITRALAKIGPPAVPFLIEAIKDNEMKEQDGIWEADRKSKMIMVLADIGDASAAPFLASILNQDLIGTFAVRALGTIGDPSVVPRLIEICKDPEWNLDLTAETLLALGKLQGKKALPVLLESLAIDDDIVRAKAAQALGEIGDRSAVRPLIRVAEEVMAAEEYDGDDEEIVMYQVIVALRRIGDVTSAHFLQKVANSIPYPDVRYESIKALAGISGIASSLSIERLVEGDEKTRENAMQELRKVENLPDLYIAFLLMPSMVRNQVEVIIDRILGSSQTPESVQEFLVHWDMAIEKGQRVVIAEEHSETEIGAWSARVYKAAKRKEEKAMALRKEGLI